MTPALRGGPKKADERWECTNLIYQLRLLEYFGVLSFLIQWKHLAAEFAPEFAPKSKIWDIYELFILLTRP